MGLRDKVALVLVTAVITQITIANCMPSSSRKACLKRYLDSYKQDKSNSVLRPSCPKEVVKTIKPIFSKCKNAKVCQKTLPEQSIYKQFNFPETEFPFETSPRDRFYLGTDFKPFEISNKQLANQRSKTFDNLKKEMRMKRKLSRLTHNENYPTKTEMPSFAEFSSFPEFVWSNDQATFPEVQYPTNAMETWIPHFWNPSLYNPYARDNSEFLTCGPKVSENTTIFCKPYKQQLKSKTKQFIEQMEKHKEKMRRVSGSTPIVDNKALDTITSGGLIESDPSSSKEPLADMPLSTDEGKCLVNTSSLNKCESVDTQTDRNMITSTTDGMEPITSQIESPLVSPVPIPNDSVDDISIQPALDPKPIVNETNSSNNGNAPENTQTQMNETSPEPSSNDTASRSDNDTTLPVQDNSETTNSSEPLNVISSNPPDSATISTPNCMPVGGIEGRPINSPYTSIFVVPVSNSISKIELPTIESNSGTPIILILSSPPNNEKSALSSPNTYQTDTTCPKACNNSSDPQETNSFVCDVCSNVQPTPLKYILEIPSTDASNWALVVPDFEMLPNNSMCYDSIQSDSIITPAPKDVNPSEMSTSDNSTESGPYNGQTETATTDNSKNDVVMDTTQPETSAPENSSETIDNTKDNSIVQMDPNIPERLQPNTETAPTDNIEDNTSAPKDSNSSKTRTPDNSTNYGPNPKETEAIPSHNIKGDTYPSEDKILPGPLNTDNSTNNEHAETSTSDNASDSTSVPEETNPSQPDNSTYSGSINGQSEDGPNNTDNTAVPDNANPLETSQSNDSTNPATNNEQAESPLSGNSRDGASVPEEPNPSQPEKSTNSGSNNGQDEAGPSDTDSTAAPENTNPIETSKSDNSTNPVPNDDQAETPTSDTTKDGSFVPEEPNHSQPDKSTDSGSNSGQGETGSTDTDSTAVPGNTSPSETSPPDNGILPNGQSEDGLNNTDNTAVPDNANPLESSQINDSTNLATNNEQAESPLSDNSRNGASVPEEPNPSRSDKSTNSGSNNGQDEVGPSDSDSTAAPANTNPIETSKSDNSTNPAPNDDQAETPPSDTTKDGSSVPEEPNPSQPDKSTDSGSNSGQGETGSTDTDNTAVPGNTSPSETSPPDNLTNPGPNNGQTETTPSHTVEDDTSLLKDMNLSETSLPNKLLNPASNERLNGIAPTDFEKVTTLTKNEDLTEAIKGADPNLIDDGKSLPVDMGSPLSSLNNNNLDSQVNKGLSNDLVPDTVKDKNLPLNALPDNPNDVGLDKGLPDIAPTNIHKTLPIDMGLPLSLLTDNTKISGLDKRLADPTTTKILENDKRLSTEIVSPETVVTNNTKNSKLDKGIVSIATVQNGHDHIKNARTLSFIKNIAENVLPDDTKKTEMDKGLSKQLKSKFVYTYRSQTKNCERQSSSDLAVPDKTTTTDDNPLRMDIELPLNSPNDKTLPDTTFNKNANMDVEVSKTPLSDKVKSNKITLDGPKDSTPISKMFKEAHNKYKLVRDEAMEGNPASYNAIHGSDGPVKEDATMPKELTSAELKDLIKYLYVAV